MKIVKILDRLSHLKWLFAIWMIGIILYIFISKSENTIQSVGTVIFLAGIMMGFMSLSDITKMSEKLRLTLLNPGYVKLQLRIFIAGIIVLIFISSLFFSIGFIFPDAGKNFISDFTNLGFDCLVMLLGFLCLIKQFADQIDFALKSKS